MGILTEKAARIGRRAIAALLPQDCLLCLAPASDALLCAACAAALPVLAAASCRRCALPLSEAGRLCGRCLQRPPHFDALLALHPYAFPVDALVQRLKYAGELAVAGYFSAALAARCRSIGADAVLAMPLHRRRASERGYNQALEIARPLARALALPLLYDACARCRDTKAQEGLKPQARRANVRHAFVAEKRAVDQRHILLIDDVATTGASLDACARALKQAGASRVSAAVIARTLPR